MMHLSIIEDPRFLNSPSFCLLPGCSLKVFNLGWVSTNNNGTEIVIHVAQPLAQDGTGCTVYPIVQSRLKRECALYIWRERLHFLVDFLIFL
jgi:hypothetical protein